MIQIIQIFDVNGSVYDCNTSKIKAKLHELYGDDIRIGYSFRTDMPDQITVYKVMEDEDVT